LVIKDLKRKSIFSLTEIVRLNFNRMKTQNHLKIKNLAILILILFSININAKDYTQTIRGNIKDIDSQIPLIGATVIILGSNPLIGTVTNLDGNYVLENVPVGRTNLQITSMGYEDKLIPNIIVGSGREVIVNIELTESLIQLKEIVISDKKYKAEASNDMALLSSRAFTVEETKRYAGTFNDPARMVSSYAGVTNDPHGNNEIVVRGNASKGIQWRLEGIEIPNPNHFADEGMTGGPINALNSDMLANSDFFTSAFAPEYGNALSGVLDMKLRNGNNSKPEYSFGISALGTDVTAEGPFTKKHSASYLVNYRYSSLDLLDKAGIVDFGGIPKYQDISYKILVPTYNFGTFSFFGLGGKSAINEQDVDENNSNIIYENSTYEAKVGLTGLNHTYLFNDKIYLKTSILLSANSSTYWEDELNEETNKFIPGYNDQLEKTTQKFASTLNYKIDSKNKLQYGATYTKHNYLFYAEYFDSELERRVRDFDNSGNTDQIQSFISWKLRISENVTMVSGLHYQKFGLNNEHIVEPRIGLKWQVHPLHSFHVGFGLHSKHEAIPAYFTIINNEDGTSTSPNQDLKMAKAKHFVLGYDFQISEQLHARIETYYQDLYDVPVENDINSSLSMINYQWGNIDIDLVNKGTGKNYGVEFTLERFFHNNFYYLITGSLFESKYTALDGIERNTTFNGNYAGNILIGKEINIGKTGDKTLGFSGKMTLIGARKITPLDLEQSQIEGYSVYQENKIFQNKLDDIFTANFSITYRVNRKKTAHELKFDIQNVTNNQSRIYPYYDEYNNNIAYSTQLGFLPNIIYRIEF
jgi:CarboxypepD_reg-like domain